MVLLCVFDPSFAGRLNGMLAEAVVEEQLWLGRTLMSVAQTRAREQGLEAGAVVRSGPVLESIEGYLCEAGASALVIGEPRIDSPLSTFRQGTVHSCARHVERSTNVEVVVVPPEE